jgi:membrane-bound lytic murein transglycosylase D
VEQQIAPCRVVGAVRVTFLLAVFVTAAGLVRAQPRSSPTNPPPESAELYEAARQLFEQFAPEEIKQQYEFPSRAEWDDFVGRLQSALEGNRLDYIEGAKAAARAAPPKEKSVSVAIPHYDMWLERMRRRPVPPRAGRLLPLVKKAFEAQGLPPELAWLAEAESTFNPLARSPVGALGLYQLMPATAQELGLRTSGPDERADPAKNAAAAAQYLKQLHRRFNDWPLAFAAYNAGPGRVSRTLAQHGGKSFADIAHVLPVETRMYVPKVLATLAHRAGTEPHELSPPR